MKNKYCKNTNVSEAKFRQIIYYFAYDETAIDRKYKTKPIDRNNSVSKPYQ